MLSPSGNQAENMRVTGYAATERYMRVFYEHYFRGELSSAGAAQAAARTMMRDPVFSHPYFWAAFIVLSG